MTELIVREDLHGSCLSIWWYHHWLERRSAIGRSGAVLFLCRFLKQIPERNGGEKRCARRSLDEAFSSVPVNGQDQSLLLFICANQISEVLCYVQSSITETASNLIRYNTSIRDLSSSNRGRLLNQVVFKLWRIQILWRMLKPLLCLLLLCWFSLVLG